MDQQALWKKDQLLVIAGPCTLESRELALEIASHLTVLQKEFPNIQFLFKGSFDKANRTSSGSPRGPGIEEGLQILQAVHDATGFPTLTDIHLPAQAAVVSEVCQVLQIPAFLCRQSDLLEAAAQTNSVINVKKGQFLSPYEMEFVVKKLQSFGAREVWATERGTTFGYQNLVVDPRSFPILRQWTQPVIFDATHSVQLPGAASGTTGGQREFSLPLARAALAAGAQGLFLETHPRPNEAWSDGPNMVPLHELKSFLASALSIWLAG